MEKKDVEYRRLQRELQDCLFSDDGTLEIKPGENPCYQRIQGKAKGYSIMIDLYPMRVMTKIIVYKISICCKGVYSELYS